VLGFTPTLGQSRVATALNVQTTKLKKYKKWLLILMSLFIIVHVIRVVALNIPTNYDEELKP